MINKYLHLNQLKAVFGFLFPGQNITVLRFLRHAGRSKVCWIYFCQGKCLRATFVSFKELLQAYYRWLSTVNFLRLRFDESKAIGRANFSLINVGDVVFHATRGNNQMGVVVNKYSGSGTSRIEFSVFVHKKGRKFPANCLDRLGEWFANTRNALAA